MRIDNCPLCGVPVKPRGLLHHLQDNHKELHLVYREKNGHKNIVCGVCGARIDYTNPAFIGVLKTHINCKKPPRKGWQSVIGESNTNGDIVTVKQFLKATSNLVSKIEDYTIDNELLKEENDLLKKRVTELEQILAEKDVEISSMRSKLTEYSTQQSEVNNILVELERFYSRPT